MTNELVAFLRARLDEDEQAARAALPGPWMRGTEREHLVDHVLYGQSASWPGHLGQVANFEVAHNGDANAAHIARWDPARVLRDVEAKRALIAAVADDPFDAMGAEPHYKGLVWCHLALPYAGHPDYREEWRP